MKVAIREQPVSAFYGEQVTLVSAVYAALAAPAGTRMVMLNGTAAFTAQICGKISQVLKTTDDAVTFTDYTTYATDKSTSTDVDLSSLSTAANGDYWYVTSKKPFGGVICDVDSVNSNASVQSGYFWTGTEWASLSITDGTANGGACFAQDGMIYWTVPTNWKRITFNGQPDEYVARFQVSAALDAATTLNSVAIVPAAVATLPFGYFAATTDYTFGIDPNKSGGVAFYIAGTPTINVTWIKDDSEATV